MGAWPKAAAGGDHEEGVLKRGSGSGSGGSELTTAKLLPKFVA